MASNDELEVIIVPETPKTIAGQEEYVYIPIVTTTQKGIASFAADQFDVNNNGLVSIKFDKVNSQLPIADDEGAKGIATFNPFYFGVSNGRVSIDEANESSRVKITMYGDTVDTIADDHLVIKKDGLLKDSGETVNSFVKRISGSEQYMESLVYGTRNGNDVRYALDEAAIKNTVVKRTSRGTVQTAEGTFNTDAVNKTQLDTKLDKAGGAISGNLDVMGDLYVAGKSITQSAITNLVENAYVVVNSNGTELATTAGVIIRTGIPDAYAIVYDPVSQGVALIHGTYNATSDWFSATETPMMLTTRVDASQLTNTHLLMWDAANNRLVDSTFSAQDIIDTAAQTALNNAITEMHNYTYSKNDTYTREEIDAKVDTKSTVTWEDL